MVDFPVEGFDYETNSVPAFVDGSRYYAGFDSHLLSWDGDAIEPDISFSDLGIQVIEYDVTNASEIIAACRLDVSAAAPGGTAFECGDATLIFALY